MLRSETNAFSHIFHHVENVICVCIVLFSGLFFSAALLDFCIATLVQYATLLAALVGETGAGNSIIKFIV